MDAFAHFLVHLAETLFFLGILGSTSVVVLSLMQDLHELLKKDESL